MRGEYVFWWQSELGPAAMFTFHSETALARVVGWCRSGGGVTADSTPFVVQGVL